MKKKDKAKVGDLVKIESPWRYVKEGNVGIVTSLFSLTSSNEKYYSVIIESGETKRVHENQIKNISS